MTDFFNPLLPAPHPDPWVMVHQNRYYYCGSVDNQIYILESPTLFDLRYAQVNVVWRAPETGRNSKDIWAPELHRIGDRWFIYYAADDGVNENHRMFVLESASDDPMGPYIDLGQVTDETDRWAIDGTVLQHPNGQLYFIWSGWEGDINIAQNLYIASLDRDRPWVISSPRVLLSVPEHDWEKIGEPFVNEGPEVLIHGDQIFIIYSASGSWTEDYCLGMLHTDIHQSPLNASAWQKVSEPVFRKDHEAGVYGVGHASFIQDHADGSHWIIYHGMEQADAGWVGRSARIQRFHFDDEGFPQFGPPLALSCTIAM